jgi:hypothetical protein
MLSSKKIVNLKKKPAWNENPIKLLILVFRKLEKVCPERQTSVRRREQQAQ